MAFISMHTYLQYYILQNCLWWKSFTFLQFLWQLWNFYSEIVSFNKGIYIKWCYTIIKACEKDISYMPLPSPSSLLKKQLDSAVLEEANKEASKLIMSAGRKQSYTPSKSYHCKACSRAFISNSSSAISALARLWCQSLFTHMHLHVWQ